MAASSPLCNRWLVVSKLPTTPRRFPPAIGFLAQGSCSPLNLFHSLPAHTHNLHQLLTLLSTLFTTYYGDFPYRSKTLVACEFLSTFCESRLSLASLPLPRLPLFCFSAFLPPRTQTTTSTQHNRDTVLSHFVNLAAYFFPLECTRLQLEPLLSPRHLILHPPIHASR